MLTSFNIKNYKCFRELDVPKLTRFNLVGGSNNCGKTSFLEALFLAFNNRDVLMFKKNLIWRGIPNVSDPKTGALQFSASCHDLNIKQPIVFNYTFNDVKKQLLYRLAKKDDNHESVRYPMIDNLFPDEPDTSPKDLYRVEIVTGLDNEDQSRATLAHVHPASKETVQSPPESDVVRFENARSIATYNNDTVASIVLLHESGIARSLVDCYSSLAIKKQSDSLLRSLQVIEPRLKSLSLQTTVRQGELIFYADVEGLTSQMSLSLLGEGLVRLLRILLYIRISSNGFCLIDEIENGFHHFVMDKVWQAIVQYAQKQNVQIVASTHNREFIQAARSAMPPDQEQDFQFIRIDHNKKTNKHRSCTYDCEMLDAADDMNWAIR